MIHRSFNFVFSAHLATVDIYLQLFTETLFKFILQQHLKMSQILKATTEKLVRFPTKH